MAGRRDDAGIAADAVRFSGAGRPPLAAICPEKRVEAPMASSWLPLIGFPKSGPRVGDDRSDHFRFD